MAPAHKSSPEVRASVIQSVASIKKGKEPQEYSTTLLAKCCSFLEKVGGKICKKKTLATKRPRQKKLIDGEKVNVSLV